MLDGFGEGLRLEGSESDEDEKVPKPSAEYAAYIEFARLVAAVVAVAVMPSFSSCGSAAEGSGREDVVSVSTLLIFS